MRSLIVGLLVLACPAGAQVSGTVSVSVNATSSDGWHRSRDRQIYGLRYRTPPVRKVTLQGGVMATVENGIVFPTAEGMRHFAGAVEYAVTPWYRVQGIYGILLEFRDAEKVHDVPLSSYYRLWAIGQEVHGKEGSLTVERLLASPMATHAALHHWIIKGHTTHFDVMAQQVGQSPNQTPYRFWTVDGTVRPFASSPSVLRYVGLMGGTRPMLSADADRSHPMAYVGAGLTVALHASP